MALTLLRKVTFATTIEANYIFVALQNYLTVVVRGLFFNAMLFEQTLFFEETYDPCSSAPCRNGGECRKRDQGNSSSYRCLCDVGWNGLNCDKEVCKL